MAHPAIDALGALDVLVLDCQATGAHPAGGHLLEIGWARTRACDWGGQTLTGISSHLLRLPPDADFPPRVSRITGISPSDLASAPDPAHVWDRLLHTIARDGGRPDTEEPFPTVIHFSRFERPFLQHLHVLSNPDGPFPLRIICTHEIVRRLLPELPRRGLRAAAGYFGHGVPEARRCAPHVAATAAVWAHCVAILETDHGVETLDALGRWLRVGELPTRVERRFPLPRQRRLALPDRPGVYRMRRSNSDLLYIGKAANLRQRVATYFHRGRRHPEHILEMLSQARDVEVTETGSAMEAALLESDEIKASVPPYNRALKNGERQVVFCARNYSRQAFCPDECHPLGPLPGGEDVAAMGEVAGMIAARAQGAFDLTATADSPVFGFFGDSRPDGDSLSLGLDVFWERHQSLFANRPAARAMIVLGARLWRERLDAVVESGEEEAEDENGEENEKEVPDWTPENVAGILEGVICRGARMIRRARWLCLLSEATVCWERGAADGGPLRLLVVTGGMVVSRQTLRRGAALKIPPGWARGVRLRQQNFDAATYDRLRIVTTELRRLLAQGRHPRVCVGPGRTIGPVRLARGLAWI